MSFTAHLRCANQGVVRILLLPGANAPNVHKCTVATEKNMMTFMAWQGQRSNPGGVPGPDQARPTQCALFNPKVKGQTLGESPSQTKRARHSVPYLAQRSKVKKCTRTRPALTTQLSVRPGRYRPPGRLRVVQRGMLVQNVQELSVPLFPHVIYIIVIRKIM